MVCSCTLAGTKTCLTCPQYYLNDIASLPVELPGYPIGKANMTMMAKIDELIDAVNTLKKHIEEHAHDPS